MSLSPYSVVVFSQEAGNVIPFAQMAIKIRNPDGSSGAYAPIYTTSSGTTPITQPGASADMRGTFVFYTNTEKMNAEYAIDGATITLPIGDDAFDTSEDHEWLGENNFLNLLKNGKEVATVGDIANTSATTKSIAVVKNILSRNNSKVVFTGDSISYNHQDLDATARPTGESCHSGMRSWSFMLGEIIHKQDAWFKHADEMDWGVFGDNSIRLNNAASSPQIVPFGGRVFVPKLLPSDNPVLTVEYKHQGDDDTAYFLIHGDPSGFSANYSYSVDGVLVGNSTTKLATTGLNSYQGRDVRHIAIPVPRDGKYHTIRFYNFSQAANSPDPSGQVQLPIIGFSSKYTDVSHTGVGGFNTADLLTQWTSRAVNLNPDVLFLLIGANDSFDGLPISNFKANLKSMIDQVRAVKPDCHFVMMSTPGSTAGEPNAVDDETTLQYVTAMQEVSVDNNCSFVNLFELFQGLAPDLFRFDWVHLNRFGNTMLCDYMARLLGLNFDTQDTDTDFSLVDLADYNVEKIQGVTGIASPAGTGTNPKTYGITVKQGYTGVVKSAISTDGELVRVTFSVPLSRLGVVSVTHWGFFGAELLTPVLTTWGADYIEFKVVKADGLSVCQHSDYPTLSSAFNFLVTYTG